jgi:hypothetical protein
LLPWPISGDGHVLATTASQLLCWGNCCVTVLLGTSADNNTK